MLFNSTGFIFLFLPVTLTCCYWLRFTRSLQVSVCFLVKASLFFYGWWKLAYLFVIIVSLLFNYSIGVLLSRAQNGDLSYYRLA